MPEQPGVMPTAQPAEPTTMWCDLGQHFVDWHHVREVYEGMKPSHICDFCLDATEDAA